MTAAYGGPEDINVAAELEQLRAEIAKAIVGLDYMKRTLCPIGAGILLIIGELFLST